MGFVLKDYREERDWKRPWVEPPRWYPCCCNVSETYGYYGGGFTGGNPVATVDKLAFSAETFTATTTANLSLVRGAPAAFSNPDVAGYILGGVTAGGAPPGSIVTRCDKLTFSTDTTASTTTGNLSLARDGASGVSERSTKGYSSGGETAAGLATTVVSDKTTFSTDSTAANTGSDLSAKRAYLGAITEGSTKGYVAGGWSTSGSNPVKTADKVTYSSDTSAAATSANLVTAVKYLSGGSDGSTKGYWAGGDSGPGAVSNCDKLTFSTDTTSAQTSANVVRANSGGSSNGTIMVIAGGFLSPNILSNSSVITFATDVSASYAAVLSTIRMDLFGLSVAAL